VPVPRSPRGLAAVETAHALADAYLWLSTRLGAQHFPDEAAARATAARACVLIERGLATLHPGGGAPPSPRQFPTPPHHRNVGSASRRPALPRDRDGDGGAHNTDRRGGGVKKRKAARRRR